jgi:rubredoxin
MDPIRLVVAPEDALTAGLIFAQPLQQDSDNLVDEDPVFIEPVCPQCGAVDPLLESVEPTNQWRCEACEHVWNDADIALNG